MAPASSSDARTKALVLWGLRILVALIFTAPALLTLGGQAAMVRQFDAFGFGPWFRFTVALVQIMAALFVLWPVTSLAAAIVLLLLDVTILLSELFVVHGGFIHLVLFALPLLALISVQSGRFDRRLAELDK
ncbi:hypothetical protein ACMDCR_18490 [Labrys okinawensis]|uniref:hypothetical protein n=1 Tax=Labrys okinawensis TaxID=346911 RepID=UPI0039BC43F7